MKVVVVVVCCYFSKEEKAVVITQTPNHTHPPTHTHTHTHIHAQEYAALWYARFTGTLPPPPTNPQQSPPPPLQSPPPPQPSGGDGLQKQTKNDGWFDRLCGVYQHVPTTVYGVYAVQAVQLLDIPLSAVDFHVCRIVDELAGALGCVLGCV